MLWIWIQSYFRFTKKLVFTKESSTATGTAKATATATATATARAPERWERWERVPSQVEILAATFG